MKIKGIVTSVSVLLLLTSAVSATDPREVSPVIDPEIHLTTADPECEEDDHACLVRRITRRMMSERRNTRLYFERGNAHLEAENFSSAAKDYTRYLKANPDDADALYGRGLSLSGLGLDKEAVKDFDRAIRLDAANADFYVARGNSLDAIGKRKEALADYSKAIEFDPENARAYLNRASVIEDADPARAYSDYSRAIELDPDYAEAYFNRATILIGLGEYEKSLKDLETALKLAPDDSDTYYYLGFAKWSLGDLNAGIENLSKAIELDPNDAENFETRARAYDHIGETDKAQADRAAAARITKRK